MKKKFNITGLCFPDQHYMADVSKKLARAYDMVESGDYFIINRPRQYGKTTSLHTLANTLRGKEGYLVCHTSFGGIGEKIFTDEQTFSTGFVKLLSDYADRSASDIAAWLKETAPQVQNLQQLSETITALANRTDKKIVLLIDEVDKSSNNQLFVSFLAMLREKYLERGNFKTFHSVVLAGVHDVKSMKLKLRPDEEQKYNSPWNIAAEFKVDMNLQPFEIIPMLEEYCQDRGVTMDTQAIAERLFYYTSGYPFLVSKLCKMLDEDVLPTKTDPTWTLDDLEKTVYHLTRETNTNFESLLKNLENSPELYELTYKMLIEGDYQSFNLHDPLVHLGMTHGIFKNGYGIKIHNLIYEELIYDYMTSRTKSKILLSGYTVSASYRLPDGALDMPMVLTKFQTFMREQYSKHDKAFLEQNGRLIFLAFIKPIINGSGYDFKEVQISEERRLDVVITYLQHKYIAELKIWRGAAAHKKGLTQLADYLDRQNLSEGYLLVFDQRDKKTWKKGWTTVAGKRIFVAWV